MVYGLEKRLVLCHNHPPQAKPLLPVQDNRRCLNEDSRRIFKQEKVVFQAILATGMIKDGKLHGTVKEVARRIHPKFPTFRSPETMSGVISTTLRLHSIEVEKYRGGNPKASREQARTNALVQEVMEKAKPQTIPSMEERPTPSRNHFGFETKLEAVLTELRITNGILRDIYLKEKGFSD